MGSIPGWGTKIPRLGATKLAPQVLSPHATTRVCNATEDSTWCKEDPLEEGMATPSSILAWKIPWAEEPGGLQSMGSQRVGHN